MKGILTIYPFPFYLHKYEVVHCNNHKVFDVPLIYHHYNVYLLQLKLSYP